jgi:hypothetical protein
MGSAAVSPDSRCCEAINGVLCQAIRDSHAEENAPSWKMTEGERRIGSIIMRDMGNLVKGWSPLWQQ